MNPGIFLIQDNDELIEMNEQAYDSEDLLQTLLAKYLQAGRIRLLFIADEIPTKLQRIVEFLNEQMNPAEVLAIEIKQFVGQGLRGLVPRVIGQTAEAIEKSPISEVGQIQLEFWTAFKRYMDGTSKIACPKPAPQSWMNHSIGVSGFGLSSIASTWSSETSSYEHPEIRAEFWMNGSDFRTFFAMLEAQKSEIESEVGQRLVWDNSPEKKRSRKIYMRKSADFLDQTKWPEQHEWLRVSLEKLNRVFATRVKNLDALRVSAGTQSP